MPIVFHDDAKQKHQSIEARFMVDEYLRLDAVISDMGYVQTVGYGANKDEAQEELIDIMKRNVEYFKQTIATIEGLIKEHDKDSWTDGFTRHRQVSSFK